MIRACVVGEYVCGCVGGCACVHRWVCEKGSGVSAVCVGGLVCQVNINAHEL